MTHSRTYTHPPGHTFSSPASSSALDTHEASRHLLSSLHGVPSAQGRLPFLVVHCIFPSSRHHSCAHAWSSGALGQWVYSSPKACWHCRSRPNILPGSSVGKGMLFSGGSSKQSPEECTCRVFFSLFASNWNWRLSSCSLNSATPSSQVRFPGKAVNDKICTLNTK